MSLEWNETPIEDLCLKVSSGGTPKSTNEDYYGGDIPWLNTKEINFNRIYDTEKHITQEGFENSSAKWVKKNSVIVAMYGATAAKVAMNMIDLTTNQACCNLTIDKNKANPKFVFYQLSNNFERLLNLSSGAAQQNLNSLVIKSFLINVPSLDTQNKIVNILSTIDDKIENLNKINHNLANLIDTNFKYQLLNFENFSEKDFISSEFGLIPKGWKVSNLTEIATYQNGLAMQKFPPENLEDSYKVLNIKELRQGFCDDSSDICTKNIKEDCIVNDGDVIFSWSGSLLVDIWSGGTCGLNQHLFKVTSEDFNKWFYYCWTKFYLDQFILIAKDKATTMGHIKREHLKESLVLIPDKKTYSNLTKLFEPLFDLLIKNKIEIKKLQNLRDTLLPKLMSGEIDVSKVNCDL